MPSEFNAYLGTVTRTVSELERDGQSVRNVTLERSYNTTPDDLWDAITNPERLSRWFLPVSGELTLNGRYQLKGNAGGVITKCVPPSLISATWEFGGAMSWIEVRIAPEEVASSRLRFSHICPVDDHWEKYGPGAVGIGWDLGLCGLAAHLLHGDSVRFDEEAFAGSIEGKAYITSASADWGRAAVAAGENPSRAEASAKLTTAFYTGDESAVKES